MSNMNASKKENRARISESTIKFPVQNISPENKLRIYFHFQFSEADPEGSRDSGPP